jgi:catechol 2,3-dioxygenase-like lactoylglutathione lyase family enzyme
MAATQATMTAAARSSVRGMAQICGFHHVSLPASDLDRSGDWHERVFGFQRVLIEEDEDRITMVMLEHPEGMLLCLDQSPDLDRAWHGIGSAVTVLGFRVASRADLVAWDKRLAELGAEHSGPRQAHLGWALDVIDPSGLRIQLHTYETISADDT